MDFEFSDDFLQVAGQITLADFFTADAVEDRTLVQLMRAVVFAGQNIHKHYSQGEHELTLMSRVRRLRHLSPKTGKHGNWVDTHCFANKQEAVSAPLPAPLPELTQPEASRLLMQWIKSKDLASFRRQDALAAVHAAGPFADKEIAGLDCLTSAGIFSDVKIRNATDNALKLLKDKGILINLPSQPGTWLVQSRFHLQEVA